MPTDLCSDQLPVAQGTPAETRRAQLTVAGYALRRTTSPGEARELAALLLDALGLNGRHVAGAGRRGKPKTPARVSAASPRGSSPGGPKEGT